MVQRLAFAAAIAAGSILGMAVTSGAMAQTTSQTDPARLEKQFEETFQIMLKDPADLDITFKYAELAIQTGDYEAAISALERMLLFNPDLPRVRLELGVLYFRLGSYAIARTYLTRAVQGDNVPDDVRARVATFLAEIDKRLSNHRISGSLYGGYRFQTNANAGPEREAISLLGAEATLDGRFTKKTDHNVFLSGSLNYVYDPQLESGDTFEADMQVYVSRQNDQKQLDLSYSELKLGPRGKFMAELAEAASIRPYVIGGQVTLDESPYFYFYGGGLSIDNRFTEVVNAQIALESKMKEFKANSDRPTARSQDSIESEASLNLRFNVASDTSITTGGSLTVEEAEESIHSTRVVELSAGVSKSYMAPFELTSLPWTSSVSSSLSFTRYNAADPAVDPNRRRHDQEWNLSLLTTVPLSQDLAIIGTLQRTNVDSTFNNFSYNNTAATIGASWRF